MLEYWLQNGEAQGDIYPIKKLKGILSPIFQRNGSHTCFSEKMFSMLNVSSRDDLSKRLTSRLKTFKLSKNRLCSFCGASGAGKLQGWMFPFIVDKAKFPNLYPNGRVESINTCKTCLVKSLRAYGAVLFSGQRAARNTIHLSSILFFSNDSSSLADFRRVYADAVAVEYYTNWKPKIMRDIVYFPHEFLMQMLDYVTGRITEWDRELGAVLISFSQTGKSKKLYEHIEVSTGLSPLVSALNSLNADSEKSRFFPFFRSMRKETPKTKIVPDAFIERNKFFRTLLVYRKIDWPTLEDILLYRLSLDKPIVHLHRFLRAVMEALSDPDSQYYNDVSRQGWLLGSSLLKRGESSKAVKASIYELRRERDDLGKFLDLVNDLQLKAEWGFDDRTFREHEDMFFKLRTFFLIGITNALFQSMREEEKEEVTSES